MLGSLASSPKAAGSSPRRAAFAIEMAVLGLVTGAGLLSPYGIGLWYRSLLIGFAGIAGAVLAGAVVATFLAERLLSNDRLQGPRRLPALMLQSARDTSIAAWIAACLLAWPLSRMHAGLPTGLVYDIEQAGGTAQVLISNVAAIIALDAWLYWKHRLLHTRLLFPFHRAHHTYRDPTSFASFAVGPVESVLTFWPVVLVALPGAPHYAPVYFGLVVGFILLNLYLHCGVASRVIEKTLPKLMFNTSAFHNRHHANANVNFGEVLIVWDKIMGTDEGSKKARAGVGGQHSVVHTEG